MTVYEEIDKILVMVWNDIANRQAGKILFKESMNVFEARTAISKLISNSN